MRSLAFALYLLFIVSWFLHMGTRVEALGTVRFDLLLLVAIVGLLALSGKEDEAPPVGPGAASLSARPDSRTRNLIVLIVAYAIVTLPFVQWPGSVIRTGLPDYIKALVFYFFTAKLVTTERRLSVFLFVFIISMTFRVIEPAYLHVTTGYWGSFATTSEGALDRLSGAPHD